MTPKQKAYRKNLIKFIHCSPLYQNVYKHDRELWEGLLVQHFGVQSSKELSIHQLEHLNGYCNGRVKKLSVMIEKTAFASEDQVLYMRFLWGSFAKNKEDEALLRWIGKIKKKLYISLEQIPRDEAGKIIAILEKF